MLVALNVTLAWFLVSPLLTSGSHREEGLDGGKKTVYYTKISIACQEASTYKAGWLHYVISDHEKFQVNYHDQLWQSSLDQSLQKCAQQSGQTFTWPNGRYTFSWGQWNTCHRWWPGVLCRRGYSCEETFIKCWPTPQFWVSKFGTL